jgi:hypothetical protein
MSLHPDQVGTTGDELDCFAVALAAEEEAELLTEDPEIIDRVTSCPCKSSTCACSRSRFSYV